MYSRRAFMGNLAASMGAFTALAPIARAAAQGRRTNVLWLIGDDLGPELGCYGQGLVRTPHLDGLAAGGRLYRNAFCTTPVCSPSRSAFNTGCYATRIGAHQHRSHREDGYGLPEGVGLAAELIREQGYYVSCGDYLGGGKFRAGKTDFNFAWESPYQGVDWSGRAAGQPFFATVNTYEPHRGPSWEQAKGLTERVDPAAVALPPYLPDDPVVRADFATYLDMIQVMDLRMGEILQRLKEEGELENTLICFFGDNGRCNIRGKQWCYDQGLRVPLIISWPGRIEPGVEERLVSLIDVTATTLNAASATKPAVLDGRDLFDVAMPARECVFASRDRCDETRDRVRAARTHRYKYIRNFMPERPYTQANNYIETWYPTLGVLKARAAAGTLTPAQALFMAGEKPAEELYDVVADPDEVNNVAGDPAHAAGLAEMRGRLDGWLAETGDLGGVVELDSAVSK